MEVNSPSTLAKVSKLGNLDIQESRENIVPVREIGMLKILCGIKQYVTTI